MVGGAGRAVSRPLSPRDQAERDQGLAADPAVSAWVEASAGSGKTKLLTDRLLRLLVAGVPPGRILCLTFTRAGAAEMATRLARALGQWAIASDAALAAELARLTGRGPEPAMLREARRLFVRVLEQPGGMRISTIHAFAQTLLRAFPLEAGLAPQFRVVEERDALALLAAEREAVLAGAPDPEALRALARLVPPQRFAQLVATLAVERGRILGAIESCQGLAGLRGVLGRCLGLTDGPCEEDEVLRAASDVEAAPLHRAAAILAASNNANDRERGAAMKAWLAHDIPGRAARWDEWRDLLLTDKGTVRQRFATSGAGARRGEVQDILAEEGARVLEVEEQRAAARVVAATTALLGIGTPVLHRYQAAKERAGLLDYDDLIARARRLLDDPGSAWVLFKLDGGLDHVLLDESQDSNPEQWGVVRALTQEFFAGESAAEAGRTVFAVGDVKQSIYGFQGADAEGFRREGAHFRRVAAEAERGFRPVRLQVSFRSTEPVLALVDAVFAEGPAREGVVEPGDVLVHRADRMGHAGAVELWPLVETRDAAAPPAWAPAEEPVEATGPEERLAQALAARIAAMIGRETLPARVERGREAEQPQGRPVAAGDILVLVRRRNAFTAALVRALKDRGVAVGGVDRMALIEQIAVQDLLALAEVLLLPEDDLALAALLRSPLVGLSEEELFALAHPRERDLWRALAEHRGGESRLGRAADWIAALMAQLDLAPPHALFAAVLNDAGPFDARSGRARLLARLGPDAADPLDEFLEIALGYERQHPPSLQGFVHWLREGGAEVKREPEGHGDAVRIMTVHGAKGLQAPIVILPDTTGAPPNQSRLRWLEDESGLPVPVWAPRLDGFRAGALLDRRSADQQREAAEEHRLLYVALTRAEDRLLVCGWQGRRRPGDSCWYRLVENGFARLPGVRRELFDPAGFGAPAAGFAGEEMLRLDCPQSVPPRVDARPGPASVAAAVPDWARRPAPAEAGEEGAAPSAGDAAAPFWTAEDPLGRRFRRGRVVHALLQHLPEHAPSRWTELATRFLARPGHGLDEAERARTLAEVLALLDDPAIAALLGPGSLAEAPLAGRIGERLVSGQVDRLVIQPDRVMVLDYKTNRPPPARLDEVPALYLRQMASYRALLRAAFPGRAVQCALLWTYGAQLMVLPGALLDRFAPN